MRCDVGGGELDARANSPIVHRGAVHDLARDPQTMRFATQPDDQRGSDRNLGLTGEFAFGLIFDDP